MGDDSKVHVTISIPRSMNDFFEQVRIKTIIVGSRRIEVRKSKSDVINRALEFSLSRNEEWLK